jgi:amino acid adenylation domain-containing protein
MADRIDELLDRATPNTQRRDRLRHAFAVWGRVAESVDEKDRQYPSMTGQGVGWTTVHEGFELQAALTPDAVAVEFEDVSVTYAQLDARADHLARHLRGLGVCPDAVVGICIERSPEMVLALLGTLKAGGAYVSLDPLYPAERLAFVFSNSGARVLLTETRLLDKLPAEVWEHRVLLDVPIPEAVRDVAPVRILPDNLAYIVYTSGSTGYPKGVAVPHRALANHMAWMQRAFPLDADDRVLQKTPASFDASIWEFWAPLLTGATLVLPRAELHLDPVELARKIKDERITILQLVPALIRVLLEDGGLVQPTSLRRLFCGGETFPADLAAQAQSVLGVEVVNLYGPTEACIDATAHIYSRNDSGPVVPIGQPVDGVYAYVLDDTERPVAAGVTGELYLGGIQLARGYLGRPERTAEQFRPDPFAKEPGARMYRTGDLVRLRSDSALEYMGRMDQQLKVRGFRIEPGDVEAALRVHPGVRDAVVVAREDMLGERRLVAYTTAQSAVNAPPAGALRAYLRERLPEYLIPSAFVSLEALPLTPNGKVDRHALPAPESLTDTPYVAPRTPVEELLSAIWADVLGVERVGADDNFFELGGHSLLATQVMSRARAAGLSITVMDLFKHPTVAEQATVATEALREKEAAREAELGRVRARRRPV